MSLDSTLYVQAATSMEGVMRTLAMTAGFLHAPGEVDEMAADGLWMSIEPLRPEDPRPIQAAVVCNFDLFFNCSHSSRTYDWTLNTVRAVMALLHAYPGDALFMYCSDYPALLRKDGRIILDRNAGLWDEGVEPDVLSLVDLPYTFGTIPVT